MNESHSLNINDPQSKTLIAIRCIEFTHAASRVADDMKYFFPEANVVFLSDQRLKTVAFPEGRSALPITIPKLDALELFHTRENVGWICGDYCYYVALEHQWDYLWLVETDVAFSGDAASIMREANATDADLIGTRIGMRPPNWPWHARMLAASDFETTQGLFFPLTRVSRRLAEASLTERQKITKVLLANPELRVPNDEVVVASTAQRLGLETLDLKVLSPDAFKNWSWQTRFCIEEIEHSVRAKFTHPAHHRDEFISKVSSDLASDLRSSMRRRSLDALSEELSAAVIRGAFEIFN